MATTGTRVRDWATVDYYATLGINPTADAEAVTRAFRALAKQLHPDAAPGEAAAERFRDVADAYAVLGDRRTRQEYDRVRAETRTPAATAPLPAPAPTGRAAPKPWSAKR